MNSLDRFVKKIRDEKGLTHEVPGFDPGNGNENAKYLFILEAPGPKACQTGIVSIDNPDITAANLKAQLTAAGIERSEIAIWNAVPWYLGNEDKSRIRAAKYDDISAGLKYLGDLVSILRELECIVLVGGAARQAHVYLSGKTSVRILSCHHTSPKVMNLNGRAAEKENIEVFKFMKFSTSQ